MINRKDITFGLSKVRRKELRGRKARSEVLLYSNSISPPVWVRDGLCCCRLSINVRVVPLFGGGWQCWVSIGQIRLLYGDDCHTVPHSRWLCKQYLCGDRVSDSVTTGLSDP